MSTLRCLSIVVIVRGCMSWGDETRSSSDWMASFFTMMTSTHCFDADVLVHIASVANVIKLNGFKDIKDVEK